MKHLCALFFVLFTSGGAVSETYKGYETPTYRIEQRDGAIELRDYAPHLVAEVTLPGGRQGTASKGFRRLAGFIFGGNETGQKIAMTAPVTQVSSGAGYTVRFALPSALALDTVPQPKDATVDLRQIAPGRQAVRQFSGRWTARRLAQEQTALEAWIETQGLTVTGPVHYYFYDDPFTLPFRRRNEVALPVR